VDLRFRGPPQVDCQLADGLKVDVIGELREELFGIAV